MFLFFAFPFVASGCLAFLICCTVKTLRRFALGCSLWCVASLPCTTISLIIVSSFIHKYVSFDIASGWANAIPDHPWVVKTATIGLVVVGATSITILHGIVIRRTTLALFRIYVAFVGFGVGVLSVLSLGMYLMAEYGQGMRDLFIANIAASCAGGFFLARFCFRSASEFRGPYPNRFPLISASEYGSLPSLHSSL